MVVRTSVRNQNEALLKNEEAQVNTLLQTALVSIRTDLRSLVYYTANAHDDPSVFAQQVQILDLSSGQSAALASSVPGRGWQVLLAQGPNLHVGEFVPPPPGSAGASLSSVVVHQGPTALLQVSTSSPIFPNLYALEDLVLHQGRASPDTHGPYSQIYVNVYAGSRPDPRQLILSTYGPRPLPGPVASSEVRFESVGWLVQAAARQPLVGGSVEFQPWLVLLLGGLLALLMTGLVETLARRERGAEHLAEVTASQLRATQKRLDRSEVLAAMGEFTSVVGHELRNPLATVINEQYLIRITLGEKLDDRVETHIENAERAAYQAAQLIDDIRSYVRDRDLVYSTFEFSTLAAEALRTAPPPQTVDAELTSSTTLWGDHTLMHQVLVNLLTNAYEATPPSGSVTVGAVSADGSVEITVHNSGTSIDPEVADHLFDPFVTTKPKGTGLGLAIVQRFVDLHHGVVSFDPAVVGGAVVRISLPAPPKAPRSRARRRADTSADD